jgi:UPF0271 protein
MGGIVRDGRPPWDVHLENIRRGRLSPMSVLDLNADLGEGAGDDGALLGLVTSANVACGFHAGDPLTMRAVVAQAAERGVAVGAHVSYPDREGFGRQAMERSAEEIAADVLYQLGALAACCAAAGTSVSYVKPHGALYWAASAHADVAEAVCAGVAAFARVPVLAPPGSALAAAAEAAGLGAVPEGFADRAYRSDGTLVPRAEPGALIGDPDGVGARAVALAGGSIDAADGERIALPVRSVCLHGDSPGAVAAARAVRTALEDAGVRVEAFAG